MRYSIVNTITTSRVLCAAVILLVAGSGHWLLILILALVAFVSDYVDGQLARRWRVTSSFGAFFDPLADKIVNLTLLWLFVFHFTQPFFLVIAIGMSIYDITTTTLRLLPVKRTIKTSHVAKLKTAVLMAALLLVLVSMVVSSSPWSSSGKYAGMALLGLATLLAATSLIRYLQAFMSPADTKIEQRARLADVDFAQWHDQDHITGVLFDVDGTLTPWDEQKVTKEILVALKTAKATGISQFGLVSNMSPSKEARVQAIAEQVGAATYQLPYHFRQRKPRSHMIRMALRDLKLSPDEAGFIGDKFVDVVAAQRAGLARVAWTKRLGDSDHPVDRLAYRPFEPFLKWLFE